jgi:hypothetical protein
VEVEVRVAKASRRSLMVLKLPRARFNP